MATMNPLERKARNSFIKGLVIAGLIGLIGIIVLAIFIIKSLYILKGSRNLYAMIAMLIFLLNFGHINLIAISTVIGIII